MSTNQNNTITIGKDEAGNTITINLEDLKKHVFISGSTGSGKSVLFRKIIEEAALNQVPSIVFDLQGDISRILIPLPEEKIQDENKEKLKQFKEKVQPIVLIPGGDINPINLGPFSILLKESHNKEEQEKLAYQKGEEIAELIPSIQENKKQAIKTYLYYLFKKAIEYNFEIDTPKKLIKALNISTFTPEPSEAKLSKSDKDKLITTLQHLQIGPLSKIYGQGEPFDLDKLLKQNKKTPIIIINLTALPDEETKNQIIANTLRRIFTWANKNPSKKLQLLVGIDELFGIAPPKEQTPPKEPLIRMATQSRKYGVGLLLSTQKPVHIDHKIVGECNTAFIGKHQGRNDWDHLSSMIKTSKTLDHQEIKNKLPQLATGEFLYIGSSYPSMFIKVIPGITDFIGSPLSIEEIKKLTPIIFVPKTEKKEKAIIENNQTKKDEKNKKSDEKNIKQKTSPTIQETEKINEDNKSGLEKEKIEEIPLKNKIKITKIKQLKAIKSNKRLPEILKEKLPNAKIKSIFETKIFLFSPAMIIRPILEEEKIEDIVLKRDYFVLTIDEHSQKALFLFEKHITNFMKTKMKSEIELDAPEKIIQHIEQYTTKTINSLIRQENEIKKIIQNKIEEKYPDTTLKQLELEFELYLEKAEEYTKKAKENKITINALLKQLKLVKQSGKKMQLQKRINNLEKLTEQNENNAKKALEKAKQLKQEIEKNKNQTKTRNFDLIIKRNLIEIPVNFVFVKIHETEFPIIWIPSIGELKIPCSICMVQGLPWEEAFTDDLVLCEKCGRPICKVHRTQKKAMFGGKEKYYCNPPC